MKILHVHEAQGVESGAPFPVSALTGLGHTVLSCSGDGAALRAAVEKFDPDALWIADAIKTDRRSLRASEPLCPVEKPVLTVGWAAAPPASDVDWSGFDLILSDDPQCLERAVERGAGKAEAFHPACTLATVSRPAVPRWDILFRGGVTAQAGSRLECLRELAKAPLGFRGECSPVFFLAGDDLAGLPSGLHLYNQGKLDDHALPTAMADSRMALVFADEPVTAATALAFAAVSSGTLLLAERGSAAERLFEPDRDFLRFGTPSELLDLVYTHRERNETAQAVTERAGRALRERHNPPARAARFAALLDSIRLSRRSVG